MLPNAMIPSRLTTARNITPWLPAYSGLGSIAGDWLAVSRVHYSVQDHIPKLRLP